MPLNLTFFGAAGEVTGSRHLLEADGSKVLMDFGLFQGHRRESIQKNKDLPFKPADIHAVLLSHAHIDHCGGLPLLSKKDFAGPIHCTRPTVELCSVMLMDSAHLQEEDADFFNRIHKKEGTRIEPLYDQDDARRCLGLFQPHEYGQAFPVAEKIEAKFLDAGHVLGSAMIQADVQTAAGRRRIVYTGDLGRRTAILMNAPQIPSAVDYLVIESTYGQRTHDPISDIEKKLVEVIGRAVKEKAKVLIPSFALERTQEIVFVIEKLLREGTIPNIPVYVDSPMAVNITKIFSRHLDCFCLDPKFKAYVAKEGDPFSFKTVRYVQSVEESKGLNELDGPMLIISASGMCEGGRILHHLRNNIDKDKTTILLVGYQAAGTLGRRLQEGAKSVKIYGLEHAVRARVETIHSFSAHADKDDLLWFIKSLDPRPRRIFLVHGDDADRSALAERLKAEGIDRFALPKFGETFELD